MSMNLKLSASQTQTADKKFVVNSVIKRAAGTDKNGQAYQQWQVNGLDPETQEVETFTALESMFPGGKAPSQIPAQGLHVVLTIVNRDFTRRDGSKVQNGANVIGIRYDLDAQANACENKVAAASVVTMLITGQAPVFQL